MAVQKAALMADQSVDSTADSMADQMASRKVVWKVDSMDVMMAE
jgi:hypothetical protein